MRVIYCYPAWFATRKAALGAKQPFGGIESEEVCLIAF
jgi:hypothetical protein